MTMKIVRMSYLIHMNEKLLYHLLFKVCRPFRDSPKTFVVDETHPSTPLGKRVSFFTILHLCSRSGTGFYV